MMRAGTVMHTTRMAASLPPLNTGSVFGDWLEAGAWGVGESDSSEAGIDVLLASMEASEVDWLGTVEAESAVIAGFVVFAGSK